MVATRDLPASIRIYTLSGHHRDYLGLFSFSPAPSSCAAFGLATHSPPQEPGAVSLGLGPLCQHTTSEESTGGSHPQLVEAARHVCERQLGGYATTAQAERSPWERVGGNKLFQLSSPSSLAGCGNGTECLLRVQENDSLLRRWFTLGWAT